MSTLTFDTLKFANRLKSAGVLPAQAEAEAEALAEVFETNLKDLATKEDLLQAKKDLQNETVLLRQELIQLEQRMTIKLGTLMVVAVGAMAALAKLL